MPAEASDSKHNFFVHSSHRRIDCPDSKGSLFSPDLGFTQIPEGVPALEGRAGRIAADYAGLKDGLLREPLEP